MNDQDIYKKRVSSIPLDKNIAWCLSIIEYHSDKLKEYQNLKLNLEVMILKGECNKSLNILDEIDDLCGVSIWSHSVRSAVQSFLLHDKSLKPIKTFELIKNNYFLQYVTYYAGSYFNDPEIYFTSRNTHFNDIIRSADSSVTDFFLYRFFRLENTFVVDFEKIYEIEKNSSLIDIFELVVFSVEYVKVRRLDFESTLKYNKNHFLSTLLKTGYTNYNDLDLTTENNLNLQNLNEEFITIDLYTEGKYEDVIIRCQKYHLIIMDFSFAELCAKSLSRVEVKMDENFTSKILEAMKEVLIRSDKYDNALSYLACLANSFSKFEWFKQLGYFVERESRNKSIEEISRSEVGLYLFSRFNSPKKSCIFDERKKYLKILSTIYNNSSSLALISGVNFSELKLKNLKINPERLNKYNALNLINEGEYLGAESLLAKLINSQDRIIKIESLKIFTSLLIIQRKFDEVLNLIIENSIYGDSVFSIFDTDLLINSIENSKFKTNAIELPILYSLHSQFVNSKFDPVLKFSFENFLYQNNLRLPTELFGKEDIFGEEKLSFFLKWICTTEIMKLYLEFETSRDIEECRLEICNYLLSKRINIDDLQFEIKNISKNLIVRKAVQQVENSRIYVDQAIYKGRNSTPYRSLFERYLELLAKKRELMEDDVTFENLLTVLNIKNLGEKSFWKSMSIVFIPDVNLSPKNATFLSLAKLMRQEFTYGEKGINNYLSTRIRHGVLPTAIRKSSMKESIYFPITMNLNSFKESLNREIIVQIKDEELERFLNIARKFTISLENQISLFNDKKLQIYTLESPLNKDDESHGMFNYSISPLETYALQSELPPSPSYEDLVRIITAWLWNRTDFILDEVKEYIETTFHSELNSIFDNFISEIQSLNMSQFGKRHFANAVSRAKAAISTDLKTVKSWFEHVDSEGDGEFELSTAIEIAKRSLSINLNSSEEYIHKMPQREVSYWVDVFFILFENALSKSKLDRDEVIINLKISNPQKNLLMIECMNNIRTIDSVENSNEHLEFYRQAYGNEELTSDAIQSEGGTGFFKVWKIIARDLGIKHNIEFGFKDNQVFYVRITLNLGASND
ncbi:hypothetical protein [Shewanella phaeophyticola]|uniref:ATP-binding protein n=1 Tax=Shewanella phaeophyticola TaxID=2978345 RepID=A0ABT2P4Q7_9GAMM|nr:hypothetical protein [Shewanella sp. KJ10-1]MCT8987647.1 hypothetical protein [Shewanella sp. KJ10-1]